MISAFVIEIHNDDVGSSIPTSSTISSPLKIHGFCGRLRPMGGTCLAFTPTIIRIDKFIRESAQTRSWETAERKARLMEIDADPLKKAAPEPNWRITIEQAVGGFSAR